LLKITFKSVGQGDSILIEWEKGGVIHYGIIDCNLINGEVPLIKELKAKSVTNIDFVVLTHMHFDHYSGMGFLFEYLIENNISVGCFYHTFAWNYVHVLNNSVISARVKEGTIKFKRKLDEADAKGILKDIEGGISHQLQPIHLYSNVFLKFLSPNGKDYVEFSRAKIQDKTVDANRLAAISLISNSQEGVLLASDAATRSFQRITGKVSDLLCMVQVPHHGSPNNLLREFWVPLNKKPECPAVFSIGDVKKDKLPKREVVEFFHNQGYFNTSTDYVYGIKEFYPLQAEEVRNEGYSEEAKKNIRLLKVIALSVNTSIVDSSASSRFFGDKTFEFDL